MFKRSCLRKHPVYLGEERLVKGADIFGYYELNNLRLVADDFHKQ